MSSGNSFTTVTHVCEDTNVRFDVKDLLIAAGYAPTGDVLLQDIQVYDPVTNTSSLAPTDLLTQIDDDTIEVTAASRANYNGEFTAYTLTVDLGNYEYLFLTVQVIIDPVNDAPSGEDKSIDLVDGSAYILSEADFGFTDVVEHNGLQSVYISSLPLKGTLLLDGVAVPAGTDVTLAELQAGKLSFLPDANSSGNVEFGFQVRDDGGTSGCGASNLDLTPNHITFHVPYASLGDFVFNDDNRNGVQDATEAGVAGVTVTLHGAGADGLFGTADDTTDVRVTDSTGHYLFDHLNAGKYQAEFSGIASDKAFTVSDQGINDAIDSDVDASGNTGVISLLAGQANTSVDAGLVSQVGAIGDLVFLDANDNGVQDAGDFGLSDMTVKLTGAGVDGVFGTSDDTTATTITDTNGNYLFSGLAAGKYQVTFSNSPYESISDYTLSNVGSDDTIDSDAGAGGLTQVVDLLPGETNLSLDGGLVLKKASLGDFVFLDKNGNGVQDAGDTGVAGVSVTLTGAGNDGAFGTADDTTTTTTTDINGKYEFTGLAGFQSYKVQFSNLPAGHEFTSRYAGGDEALDSDADASGLTQSYVLSPGENLTTVDAGLVAPKGTIGDTVFFDSNEDGLQQATEGGVGGVTVTLTGAGADGLLGTSDDTTAVATTDANGKYLFTDLTAGKYQVGYSNIPSIANYTLDHVGSDTAIDSNANPSTGLTEVIELAAGEVNLTVDGGLVLKHGAIGDFVFKDTNGNGIQDATEAGVAGVTVSLKGAGLDGTWGTADDVSRSTTTDANGKYLFSDLQTNQNYQVVFSNVPVGYEFTQANAGSDSTKDSNAAADGTTGGIYLAPAETNTTIDAGIVASAACLGDQVFFDNNNNGIQDAGDTGVAGVLVTLTGAGLDGVFGTSDDTTNTQTTDANGHYSFHNLAGEQDYKVQFSNTPTGYDFVTANVGSDDTIDSDVNASGATDVIHLDAGEDDYTIDAGLIARKGAIGDTVFFDRNENGLQDSGEIGVSGVTVTLTGAGADGVLGTSDDTTRSVTTDSNGKYLFTEVTAGKYQVGYSNIPSIANYTLDHVGSDTAIDSNANPSTGLTEVINLAAGQVDLTVDGGLVLKHGAIGDFVFKDKNGNGVQDAGEAGVAGVTVSLKGAGLDGTWGTADDVSRSTTTDANGKYLFSDLQTNQNYQVVFSNVPVGYEFTQANAGSDRAKDSNAAADGTTVGIYLAPAETNTTIDAGIVAKTVCVGDQVFVDKNKNGVQDAGDVGLAGVTVTIKGAGLDGVFGTADDTSKTTTTDNTGRYMFHDLAGDQDYKVSFSGAPAGYAATVKGAGSNTNLDSDIDASGTTGVFHVNAGVDRFDIDAGFVNNNKLNACVGDRVWFDTNKNGIQDCGECGAAGVTVTLIGAGEDNAFGTADDTLATTKTDCLGNYKFSGLSSGLQYQLQFGTTFGYTWTAKDQGSNDTVDSDAGACGLTAAFTLKSGECNTTIDAGLVCKPTACVGDRVWNDANCNGIQDAGESGLACVTVKLTGAGADGVFGTSDDICKITTTDYNGYYKFTGLIGDSLYKIDVTEPCNYTFTAQNVGTNDAIDSDVNSCGTSAAFFLAAGENKSDVDAGLFKTVTACLTGSTVLYEGCANSYKVVLSSALTTDTWVTVTALDGTAKRTDYDASVQSYDYRGTVQVMNKDYALLGTDCIIDADGVISVKIAAGQTSSSAFSLKAWQEKETVEILAPGVATGAYKEAAWEDLTLHLSTSNVQVDVTCADTKVKIGDTTCYSLYSPIALDMDGNGIHTTALIDSKGTFDLLGNGHAVNSGWLSSGDAFLAIDNNGNGKIDSVSEMFGGNKGDGFAKLASFDTNHDGVVDAKDADFGKLLVWQDLNGDHHTDAGELRTLGEAGIASLNTGFTDGAVEQLGNILGETSVATRTDGTHITTTDVYFNTDVAGASLPELSSLLSSTNALLDHAFGAAPTAPAPAAAAPAAPAANDANVTADAETLRQVAALLEQQHHAVAA